MRQDNNYSHAVPEESYSRELDSRVQAQEKPYGYEYGEPSAEPKEQPRSRKGK